MHTVRVTRAAMRLSRCPTQIIQSSRVRDTSHPRADTGACTPGLTFRVASRGDVVRSMTFSVFVQRSDQKLTAHARTARHDATMTAFHNGPPTECTHITRCGSGMEGQGRSSAQVGKLWRTSFTASACSRAFSLASSARLASESAISVLARGITSPPAAPLSAGRSIGAATAAPTGGEGVASAFCASRAFISDWIQGWVACECESFRAAPVLFAVAADAAMALLIARLTCRRGFGGGARSTGYQRGWKTWKLGESEVEVLGSNARISAGILYKFGEQSARNEASMRVGCPGLDFRHRWDICATPSTRMSLRSKTQHQA